MPLDIAAGIFISVILADGFNIPLTFGFAALCVVFALLPDIDFLFHAARAGGIAGKWAHEHRDLFHKPLFYIPVGFLLTMPFGDPIAYAFLLGSAFHFLHDSFGMGWGIKLFWPLSKKNYKLFGGESHLFEARFVRSWTDAELRAMVTARSDENWIKKFYLRPHPLGIFEYAALVLAVAYLISQMP